MKLSESDYVAASIMEQVAFWNGFEKIARDRVKSFWMAATYGQYGPQLKSDHQASSVGVCSDTSTMPYLVNFTVSLPPTDAVDAEAIVESYKNHLEAHVDKIIHTVKSILYNNYNVDAKKQYEPLVAWLEQIKKEMTLIRQRYLEAYKESQKT